MGHAAQAFSVARTLQLLGLNDASLVPQLYRLAYRISENRIVAGVHYPLDLPAGARLGIRIAEYVFARAQAKGVSLSARYTYELPFTDDRVDLSNVVTEAYNEKELEGKFVANPIISAFWANAAREWRLPKKNASGGFE
jgi:hypothetical protein